MGAQDIQRHDLIEGLGIEILGMFEDVHTGAVDQQRGGAQFFLDDIAHFLDIFLFGNIAVNGQVAAAFSGGQLGQFGGTVRVAAADGNVNAVLQKSLGNGMAQAAGTASDQCYLTGRVEQIFHRTFHVFLLLFQKKASPAEGKPLICL